MTYYNLPKEIDNLVFRLNTKIVMDGYPELTIDLKPTKWVTIIKQIKAIVEVVELYEQEVGNNNLQTVINKLKTISFFNLIYRVNELEKAVILIESL